MLSWGGDLGFSLPGKGTAGQQGWVRPNSCHGCTVRTAGTPFQGHLSRDTFLPWPCTGWQGRHNISQLHLLPRHWCMSLLPVTVGLAPAHHCKTKHPKPSHFYPVQGWRQSQETTRKCLGNALLLTQPLLCCSLQPALAGCLSGSVWYPGLWGDRDVPADPAQSGWSFPFPQPLHA